ncbi:MAG: PD40 domain-containing protein [Acidobacteriaceae bacterium]|nr:PD40 domain-containing protein [Acidobacteriaceae bacterium]
MKISRLTSGGEVSDAAVSPDGKYVSYFLRETEGQSLWIRQVAAPGTVRIAVPEAGEHFSLTFSPDGNYLYYVRKSQDGLGILYRRPALGGDAAKLLSGIRGPISFSPDGKQFAFIRMDSAHWEAALMIAQQDGSHLRQIAGRKRPSYFSSNGVAWSRDGRSIFCFGGNAADYVAQAFRIFEVRVADGRERVVGPHSWAWAGPVVSTKDGGTLLVSASERAEDAHQIWRVSLRNGEASRVTNDLSNYATLSLADDGKTLASLQTVRPAEIWVARPENLSRPVPVSSGSIPDLNSLAWTPDGKIAYSARQGDELSLFSVEPGGRPPKQLTTDQGDKTELAITSDDRYIVYQAQGKIWRMDRDGTNPRQLTRAAHDVHPQPYAAGQSVIYASFANWSPSIGGRPTLWTVPIAGGEPKQLSDITASMPQVSPDGRLIAAAYFPGDDPRYSPNWMAVFSAIGGKPLKVFTRPASASDFLHWSPDGKGLDYVVTVNGTGNIWRQSLDDSAPAQITHYNADELFDFAWSRDGSQLALARGTTLSDVVLITGSE